MFRDEERTVGSGVLVGFCAAAMLGALAGGCDDPTPGPVGGLILVVRTFPAIRDAEIIDVERVVITTRRVEVIHSAALDGATRQLSVDTQPRTIELRNVSRDRLVAQYPVPVGYVHQVRIFASDVTVHRRSGAIQTLSLTSPNLASWNETGWKIVPSDGSPWPIVQNELTGVRALFRFDDRMLHNEPQGYHIKPTVEAERFAVNPPPDEAGVFVDQITVMFRDGISPAQVDAVNGEIGASILIPPVLGNVYRVKLPSSINLQDAFAFYRGRSEVAGLLPAVNYAQFQLNPDEGTQPNHTTANLPLGWEAISNAIGTVGSRAVRMAVVDSGVNIVDPDLRPNIAINQGEIPPGIRAMLTDTDIDGVISFTDLNNPMNAAVAPPDVNMNGVVDGVDLLSSSMWADGIDQDDFDGNSATFVDDLVGWDFINNDNDPRPDVAFIDCGGGHGTCVASVAGAVGNNTTGIAGTAWVVSIVPLRASTGLNSVPDTTFLQATMYAERTGIDIVNTSQGWHFASENANLDGANKKLQATVGVSQSDFDSGVAQGQGVWSVSPWMDGMGNVTSRVLYVFAAGNSTFNLADNDIVILPSELMQNALGARVLIVGSSDSTTANSDFSSYGAPVVELWAPGRNWAAIPPSGGTAPATGTSFAAPCAAGLAALTLARFPALTGNPVGLHDRLVNTAARSLGVTVDGDQVSQNQPLIDGNAALQP